MLLRKSLMPIWFLVGLICVFSFSQDVPAQTLDQEQEDFLNKPEVLEFSARSDKAIIGRYPDLNLTFASVMQKDGLVVVDIRLKAKKQLLAKVNYKTYTYQVRFVSLKTRELVKFTAEDVQTLQILDSNLGDYYPGVAGAEGTAIDALLSTLNLVDGYPAGEYLDLSSKNTEKKTEITNKDWTSLCDKIGQTVSGTYTKGLKTFTESEVVGPCLGGDCFGRCGPSCNSPPHPLKQRFTQDCFNHDLCARATGHWFGVCADEWRAAADDFYFATDCNAVATDWTVEMNGVGCLGDECNDVHSIKVYHFHQKDTFNFKGTSDSHPIDGRVSLYTGKRLLKENRVSGRWSIPTYMGPDCGNRPAGAARGSFKGQNNCGKMIFNLEGVWGWYHPDDCSDAGDGIFTGEATADRNVWTSKSESCVRTRKRTEGERKVSAALP